MAKYLVEIKTKDWITPKSTICFKEIEALDEYYARHRAFSEFETELKYKQSARNLLIEKHLTLRDIAASDAVML